MLDDTLGDYWLHFQQKDGGEQSSQSGIDAAHTLNRLALGERH